MSKVGYSSCHFQKDKLPSLMESHSLLLLSSPLFSSPSPSHPFSAAPLQIRRLRRRIAASKNSPRGFGRPPPSNRKSKRQQQERGSDESDEIQIDDSDVAIPQIVTDRMMRRVGLSVGIPLSLGLTFFPLFYYLKVGLKIDVPTWIPFLVSFAFFGTALLGISYGIVSASWDPAREGSLIGWNEARRNWPVFWESLRGGDDFRRSKH